MNFMTDYVDYVNPYIGAIGHLLTATAPTVMLPHSMAQVSPVFTPGVTDRYLADRIFGFPAGAVTIMPFSGGRESGQVASSFDHDFETATPYYYSVLLEDYGIITEYSVTAHAIYYRFTFPRSSNSRILVKGLKSGDLEVTNSKIIRGHGELKGVKHYVYMEFSRTFTNKSTHPNSDGEGTDLIVDYETEDKECIEVKIGLSYIDVDQAYQNLMHEIQDWNFEHVKNSAKEVWNKALSSIEVKGGTQKQLAIFYTSLYRAMTRMVNVTEYGRYCSNYDKKVHDSEGHDFYVNDGLWDTYRCMHPLQLIIDSKRQMDMIRSYLHIYDNTGYLPTFPDLDEDHHAMIGNHGAAFITDTYIKGYDDFDVEKAYEAMRKNALECTKLPWGKGPLTELDKIYMEKGFFPALRKGEQETVKEVHPFERRQAVSVTLEHSYDDWCIAQMARILGKEQDYEYFSKSSRNYRNLYDERIGFMAPKDADGRWVEDFDPKFGGGLGGRDYTTECNSWVYTFHVQHDVEGLIGLMGGKERFSERLDSLFNEQYNGSKYWFLAQFPDSTGLIGQYPQGNEPSFHIPYLYNYAGQPWKTQRIVRQIMDVWYGDGPLGICGDEDGGAMSSWYVFSAIGFYPVCPGKPVYDIGSPIFEEIKIRVDGDKIFTIKAMNASNKNKYVQSAELNGQPLNTPCFEHKDIVAGSTLVLYMGERPNKTWGVLVK
nr:GH92 family glycosyl hydrolase [Mahella sp.]